MRRRLYISQYEFLFYRAKHDQETLSYVQSQDVYSDLWRSIHTTDYNAPSTICIGDPMWAMLLGANFKFMWILHGLPRIIYYAILPITIV
jgi:hypothetical protein